MPILVEGGLDATVRRCGDYDRLAGASGAARLTCLTEVMLAPRRLLTSGSR